MTKGNQKDIQYINFPIHFLKGFLQGIIEKKMDKKYVRLLQLASYYAAYKRACSMNMGDYGERMNSAMDYLGVDGDLIGEKAYCEGRRLSKDLDKWTHGNKPPMTGIKVSILQRFKYENVSDWQVVCLLGYLSLKSIIGKKSYVKTTYRFWLSRMAGEVKAIDAETLLNIDREVSQINTRRKLERLRNDLIDGWGLSYYGKATRGFYVSFSMPLEELVFQVEKKRKTAKNKARKIREEEAIKKANERLCSIGCGGAP